MSSSSPNTEQTFAPQHEIDSFIRYLSSSTNMLILAGAGLSASAGIPTFRGNGGYWRGHKATAISNIECFEELPALSWVYHAERRKMVIEAKPGRGHEVLAEVTRKWRGGKRKGNVKKGGGLSEKAKHPQDRLYPLHGSLLDIKCSNKDCDYIDKDNFQDPICPALEVKDPKTSFALQPKETAPSTSKADEIASDLSTLAIKDSAKNSKAEGKKPTPQHDRPPNPLESILEALSPTITDEMRSEPVPSISSLPHCPKCSSLLRPAVIWFGESLSQTQFDEIEAWIEEEQRLGLMMVIGTMAEVYPAAKFVEMAKSRGARVCVVNKDRSHTGNMVIREGKDWVFEGDAAVILPVLFEGILVN